jgi:hypothetical protein
LGIHSIRGLGIGFGKLAIGDWSRAIHLIR